MRTRLCACGCGERVTRKVEDQHLNALTPALLTSQVLDQNRSLIRRKKRSQAFGFSARVRQRPAMGNTTEIDDINMDDPVPLNSSMMMGEDLDHEAYGQTSRSGRSRLIAPVPHAGPSGLSGSHDDSLLPDPSHDHEVFFLDHSAPSRAPLSNDDDPISHDYPMTTEEAYDQSKLRRSRQIAPPAGPLNSSFLRDPPLDGEVYGLSSLRRSRRIADGVQKIGQQRWGSNASAHFVNNRELEESDEKEEEDIDDDEPIGDFDIDVASDDEDDDIDEMFAGPGQEGISLWDSLGEGFLREASQLRMSFS
jgi:hypothetical protein